VAFGGAAARSFARRPFGTSRRGSASSWSPLDFGADLLFWFDANVSASGALWADLSGNGYDLTQATGSKQPTLITADVDFDGNNSLFFDNTLFQTMVTPDVTYGKFELWMVMQSRWHDRLYIHSQAGNQSHSIYMSGGVNGLISDAAVNYDFIAAAALDGVVPARRVGHRWDGTNATHDILEAGSVITSSRVLNTGTSTTPTTGPWWLASYLGTGEYLYSKYSEIFAVANRVATAPEDAAVTAYLAGKFPSIP